MTNPEPSLLSLLDQNASPERSAEATGSVTLPAPAGWLAPPGPAAYHGLLGEIVSKLEPETEADPVAILTQLLVSFGAAVGRGAWYSVEATRHHPNEFLLLVGDSARARKGSSWDRVWRLISDADPTITQRILTGLTSGEGLVWAVRDSTEQDPGARDPRLLAVEPEFASVLKSATREISTLSPTLRSAWDSRPLQLLTRTAPARATSAHISLIGHITQTELRHHTNTIELANGFMNRLLIIACRRTRLLPEGGNPDPLAGTGLDRFLAATLQHARTAGELRLDQDARALWWDAYARLAEPHDDGIAGALCVRAEAHTIRLALLYTLADGANTIRPEHLHAALALWDYAARSASWAFHDATGDPLAEQIHAALQNNPGGLSRTQLRDLFHRNQPAARLDTALQTLAHADKATPTRVLTAGRPAELWTAATPKS
jgi:hypothetical protein